MVHSARLHIRPSARLNPRPLPLRSMPQEPLHQAQREVAPRRDVRRVRDEVRLYISLHSHFRSRQPASQPSLTLTLCVCPPYSNASNHASQPARTRKKAHKAADAASRKLIKRTSRSCPGCKRYIEKNGGCDHITCKRSPPTKVTWEFFSFWRLQ
jgi:hypothetical protein